MIIFADQNLGGYISTVSKDTIMNLFSSIIIGDTILDVIPNRELMNIYYKTTDDAPFTDEDKVMYKEEFKNKYLFYLCEHDQFMGIMDMMIADYYTDDNVVVLTDLQSELSVIIIECISQFIYDRWHYPTAVINDREDIENLKISEIDPLYLPIYNADIDYYLKYTQKGGE